jgi:hypothetical protein
MLLLETVGSVHATAGPYGYAEPALRPARRQLCAHRYQTIPPCSANTVQSPVWVASTRGFLLVSLGRVHQSTPAAPAAFHQGLPAMMPFLMPPVAIAGCNQPRSGLKQRRAHQTICEHRQGGDCSVQHIKFKMPSGRLGCHKERDVGIVFFFRPERKS